MRTSTVMLTILLTILTVVSAIGPIALAEGRLLDVSTQKGGIGQDVPGGNFTLGEVVELYANLTYNDFPVVGKLVTFTVFNARGELFTVLQGITNVDGFAEEAFRIPFVSESIGEWTVTASADVAETVVQDSLTFEVTYQVPPHGPKASFTESLETLYIGEIIVFNASGSIPGWNGTVIFGITEYRWDFGDGNKTTAHTPIIYHAYESPGIYYVALTVYAPNATPETDTSPFQTKQVLAAVAPVGGYSHSASVTNSIALEQPEFYIALVAIVLIGFAALRRRTKSHRNLR